MSSSIAISSSSPQIFLALKLINAKQIAFTTVINHVDVQQFQLALPIPVKALLLAEVTSVVSVTEKEYFRLEKFYRH